MAAIYFIWLGSGRARRYHVAPEGQLLDRAAKVGLPAAPGAILLDEFYRVCLEKDLAEMAGGRAVIPDAELLHATLFHSVRLPRFNRPVAVDLVAPDANDNANGGDDDDGDGASIELPPRRLIDANQPDELAQALVAAWNAVAQRDARRDVFLVEDIVAAEQRGRTHTHDESAIDYVKLYGDGETNLALPALSGWRKPDAALPPYQRRLQMLLRGVRYTFGPGRWAVDWADDGKVCHITRIAPVASSPPA